MCNKLLIGPLQRFSSPAKVGKKEEEKKKAAAAKVATTTRTRTTTCGASKPPRRREEPSQAWAGQEALPEKKLLLAYLSRSLREKEEAIQQKEADLECPVCLEVAKGQIFSCDRQHMVCARCRPRVGSCPMCRRRYPTTPLRHRYAEKNVASLQKLRKEKLELEREQRNLSSVL